MSIPNNILSVNIGNELYAFDGDKVEQILRLPAITKMPLTQSELRGISSIGGKVVTMIDMGILLGHKQINESKVNARVLTIKCNGSDYGVLVDEVLGMESIDETHYEESQKDNMKISGLYKKSNKIYQIIDECVVVNSLTLLSYKPLEIDKFGQTTEGDSASLDNAADAKSDRFLFLTLGNEEFAISLDIAREIIFLPEHITPISEAGKGVLGMITLRGELIVAIDLKKVIGVPEKSNLTQEDKKEHRLLILSYKGKSLAILVDGISEVKDIFTKDMEVLPDRFADSKIESVYKSTHSIVSIVSKEYLTEILEEYSIEEEKNTNSEEALDTAKQENNMSEIAVFKIAKEEYALDIEDVQEIIKYTEITPIPEAPDFVDGVINLRGVVIPIVSLPERLGFEKKIDIKSKILVCTIKGEKIGLLVDDVNEIMFIEDKYISKSQSEDAIFSEIITLNEGKRIILKLKISNVVDDETINNIKISQDK